MTRGLEKLTSLIRRELAAVLAEARDPRLGFLTLMDVELSPDLRHAQVFISVVDETQEAETLAVLKAHKGHFRSELAKRVELKRTPELHFKLDELQKRAHRIDALFDQIASERGTDAREDDVKDVTKT